MEASEPQRFHGADGEGHHLQCCYHLPSVLYPQIEKQEYSQYLLFFFICLNSNLYIWKSGGKTSLKIVYVSACYHFELIVKGLENTGYCVISKKCDPT